MNDNETTRLARLTSILTQLQSTRLITATTLANKFNVSIRTIYRDIRSLEQSGVPILTEEGRGYSLMEGYRLPPISFTESEANALITAEKIISGNKDLSFIKEYTNATAKIKAVLRYDTKENAELLSSRMAVSAENFASNTSNYLVSLQLALTSFNAAVIFYQKENSQEISERIVEPFALFSTQGNWLLLAWCRLRKGFRIFRLDRIQRLLVLEEKFPPHKMTLEEYFKQSRKRE